MTLRAAIACATVLLASGAGAAEGCEPTGPSNEFEFAGLYLDNDICQIDGSCIVGVWVYQESNGIAGLQRQDAHYDDTCGGKIPGDTLLVHLLEGP